MSKHIFTIPILALTVLLLGGCDAAREQGAVAGHVPEAKPSVAIIDLLVIAKATGQDESIREQVEQATVDLNTQLAQIAKDLEKQLSDEKEKLGDELDAEQQQQLQALQVQAQRQFSATQAQARQHAEKVRVQLVTSMTEQVKPIAERIARERGASVVLMTDTTTLWYAAKVDITDEVIAALRALPATAPDSSAPTAAASTNSIDTATPTAETNEASDPAAK